MAAQFSHATHVQVLKSHPDFELSAVVDISQKALQTAREVWEIDNLATSIDELPNAHEIEVAIIATPPADRLKIIESLPALSAVLVEKPLGTNIHDAKEFLAACSKRNILVQVNLLRRADETMRLLAAGRLHEIVGQPQCAAICYGNGLLNNGTHMVDLARMLLGEIEAVNAHCGGPMLVEGPIEGDLNFALSLQSKAGPVINLQPLSFKYYRENSLDIWGDKGRLAIMNEGLTMLKYSIVQNRSLTNAGELASEDPQVLPTNIGTSLFGMYSNLAQAMAGRSKLFSSGDSALLTAAVIEAGFLSLTQSGAAVKPYSLF